MAVYHLAGEDFKFLHSLFGFASYESEKVVHGSPTLQSTRFNVDDLIPISQAEGWVSGRSHHIEMYRSDNAFFLRVEGVGEFFIDLHAGVIGRLGGPVDLTQQESEVLSGPVLVYALALRGCWSFHASAVSCNTKTIAFFGESGRGKSTLSMFLSQKANWRLVADDILPVTGSEGNLIAWPHFPQLKLPIDAQPSANLPEQLPLNILCELVPIDAGASPEIKRLSPEQAVMVLLGHTAGSRLFDAKMLEAHLMFCSQAAEYVTIYQLKYPHSKDALPKVKEMLESLC